VRARHFELLLEEPSMEAFLRALLPNLLPGDCTFDLRSFKSKGDLLRKLPGLLRGYAQLPEDWRVIVLVDRDNDDCIALKQDLEETASSAGLRSLSADRTNWQIANRIVVQELEAWFFGDWSAVRAAYPRVNASLPRRLRTPDAISKTWETFERELQRAGYFGNGLRKIEAAREVARHFDPGRNTSHSFRVFRDAILEAAA